MDSSATGAGRSLTSAALGPGRSLA